MVFCDGPPIGVVILRATVNIIKRSGIIGIHPVKLGHRQIALENPFFPAVKRFIGTTITTD